MKAAIYRQSNMKESLLPDLLRRRQNLEVIAAEAGTDRSLQRILSANPHIVIYECGPIGSAELLNIQAIQAALPHCAIIVAGDKASFPDMIQLLRLHIFDCLLSPWQASELDKIIEKAMQWAAQHKRQHQYHSWLLHKFAENRESIQQSFFVSWLTCRLDSRSLVREAHFLGLNLDISYTFVMMKPAKWSAWAAEGWDTELAYFTIKNVVSETLDPYKGHLLFRDGGEYLIAMIPLAEAQDPAEIASILKDNLKMYVSPHISTGCCTVEDALTDVPHAYGKLAAELKQMEKFTPVVQIVKGYIDQYYHETLRLNDIADRMRISPAYLSFLIKRELGMSFIEYVTKVRIETAIQYMSDPTCKIYEVAGRVGYQSQHYFSTSFKKFTGVSPSQYIGKRAAK